MISPQLPLPVQLRETASFETFHAGPNAEAVKALEALTGPVLLFGPEASGRTHLLQAAARRHRAAYLPLADLRHYGPEALQGYEAHGPVCVDDLEAVADDRDWCLTLLRLIDRWRTDGKAYVFAAEAPPERLRLALPDLRTRLAACSVIGLRPLQDEDRRELLQERSRARGLEMPPEVSRWLLHTHARDTASLLEALEQLDRAALSAKRRLTLPFVQSVLAPRGEEPR